LFALSIYFIYLFFIYLFLYIYYCLCGAVGRVALRAWILRKPNKYARLRMTRLHCN